MAKQPKYKQNQLESDRYQIEIGNNGIKYQKSNITFLNKNQLICAQEINKNDITFITGPAGTAKTFIPVAMALKAIEQKSINKLYLVRPTVQTKDEDDEGIGYLTGNLNEKMTPYLMGALEAVDDILGNGDAEEGEKQRNAMLDKKIIEIVPVSYIRGRTLKSCFTLIEEAQGLGPKTMKAILTRPGPNSKTVISGDVTQKDNTGFHPNYLEIVAERFIDRGHGGYVQFNKNDIVRSTKTRAVIETLDELHEELERALLLKSNQSQLRITK